MGYNFRPVVALLLSTPSFLFAADRLIFAVDIIRHGDRTPIVSIPSLNYEWAEGLGQLTAEGMQQEYNMGMEFRKKYVEQTHLLPERYEAGTMYVRSTDFERTLMSAQSLLMGLYPPGTGPNTSESAFPALPHSFQPIPVFSAPYKFDDVIVQPVSAQVREKLMQQYVYPTKEWQQKNNEMKSRYPRWSSLTDMTINKLQDLGLLGDTLFIHKIHHAPMPEGLSSQEIDEIINVCSWAFMAQERPQQVARVYSTKLMTNIAKYLNRGSLQKSRLKYVLLSAHDNTIASSLSFLGAPLEQAPPYASNLNFSLYEHDANSYTVKVTYNGMPVTIPACGGTVCELQQFTKLANSTNN